MIVDESLAAINSLHESSVDIVIDTIGGRRRKCFISFVRRGSFTDSFLLLFLLVYDASRRILHFNGSFYTTIGDTLSPPDTSIHFKTSMRSLRRTFFKKDQKQINYWCLALDDREVTKLSLETLKQAVERGGVRATIKRVWKFGDEACDDWEGEGRVIKMLEN